MLKKLIKEKPLNLNVKATAADLALAKKKANQYTNGNISAWVRYSMVHCVPPKNAVADRN